MKISHSAINEYNDCGFKYKLNRIDRIRPEEKSSAFVFGSAIDDACESILLRKDNYKQVFLEKMQTTDIHGKVYDTRDCHLIKYFSKDLQPELLDNHTIMKIETDAEDILEMGTFELPEFLKYVKANKKNLSKEERVVFNIINYESLCKKGLMMLEVLKKWIDENIQEVHSIQKKLVTENTEGDTLEGYIDFIATFKDGVKRIVDLKTASDPKRQYPDNCIEESQQLTIYSEIEDIKEVAYLIIDKSIRKKEPRVRVRYVSGTVTENNANKIFDKIEESLVNIKNEVFEKNLNSCHNYGGCPYRNFCKSGGQNIDGLIKLGERKDV